MRMGLQGCVKVERQLGCIMGALRFLSHLKVSYLECWMGRPGPAALLRIALVQLMRACFSLPLRDEGRRT
eukprot:615593-Amphidinium_carterae.1